MSGVLGVVDSRGQASNAFDAGARNWRASARHLTRRIEDDGARWTIGTWSLGILDEEPVVMPGGEVVFVRGELLSPSGTLGHEKAARRVGAAYLEHGISLGRHLDGAFVAVILDPRRRRTLLVCDAVGSYPIYWTTAAGRFTFSSELSSLITAQSRPPALDLHAVADYLTIGFVTGNRTLAAGVSVVGPGSVLGYDWDSDQIGVDVYHQTADFFSGERLDRPAYVERLTAAFQTAVSRALEGRHQFGLSLSGGLDSRAVLSAVNGHHGSMISYTVGVPGCADQAIARRLSAMTGTDHRFFSLDDRYLKDFLPNQARMVSLTDGHYLSHGLTEVLVLQFLADTGIEVLLRGHGGELAKTSLAWPLHTDAKIHAMTDRRAFVDYLARRASYVAGGVQVADVLTTAAASLAGRGAVDSLHELLDDVPLTPAELCSYVYLREHHRRFTVPSLELFRTVAEVRLPFVDRDFLVALFAGDPRWRDDTSLHRALTAHGNAALLKVRNSNTGAPGDAGPLVEQVLDKFNTLFKRLNVPGYRHYHDFDRWLRTMLLETVERELLSPAARTSAFVRPDTLRRLVDQTRRGASDHGYLLQVLLIIELWQREHGVSEVAA